MEYIKKYWFVALVGLLLCVGCVYFAIEESASKFEGKKVNGQDVVFEYNGQAVTADELFDAAFNDQAPSVAVNFLQMAVYRKAFEPTNEILDQAKELYQSYLSYYKYNYGENYEENLLPALNAYGYSKVEDLEDYYVSMLMNEKLISDFFNEHIDEYWTEFNEKNSPRIVSHILVKMEDPETPTAEQQAKLDAIDAALASGTSFADVAAEFSEDSSAADGGNLGYTDKNTSFVKPFLDAALALNEGETSEWVTTTYGRHLIKCDAASKDALIENQDFISAISNAYNNNAQIFKAEYEKHNVDYHGYDIIKDYIESQLAEVE